MRAIRIFIAEGEGAKGKASGAQGPTAAGEEKKSSVVYEPLEQPSPIVREEEFAKQLRLARYLAGTSLGAARTMEKVGERGRSVSKPRPKTKTQPQHQRAKERELERERRRAQHKTSAGRGRSKKQRSGPSR